MSNVKVIGIGAGGNKSAINLIEKQILPFDSVMLWNSTLQDVPAKYKEIAYKFHGDNEGCGKETSLGREIAFETIRRDSNNIDTFLSGTELAIVIGTTEGGTGCGAVPVFAQYCKEALQLNVSVLAITGFGEDTRGKRNTCEFFTNLSQEYAIQTISNSKFLSEANGDIMKAEELANEEIVKRVSLLIGKDIVDGQRNIDRRDLYKLATQPGYTVMAHGNIQGIKNVEGFNKRVAEIIDGAKCLDTVPSAKRIGIIINAPASVIANFDQAIVLQKLGHTYEVYKHFQDTGEEEYIKIIGTGMKMPAKEIKRLENEYREELSKVDTSKDDFFQNQFSAGAEADIFDVGGKKKVDQATSRANFFDNFKAVKQPASGFSNMKLAEKEKF